MADHNSDMRTALYKSENSRRPVLSPGVGSESKMSRRKQTNPRHLEADEDEAALQNGDKPAVTPLCEPEVGEFEDEEEEEHRCEQCEEQFVNLEQLLEHQRHCYPKSVLFSYGADIKDTSLEEEEDEGMEEEEATRLMMEHLNGDDPAGPSDDVPLMMSERAAMAEAEDAMRQAQEEKSLVSETDAIEEGTSRPEMDVELDEPMDITDKPGDSPNASSEDGTGCALPQMPVLAPMSFFHDSNVKLESLENTKVAVAQFAENNNIPPADLAVLQTTLYSLQQQQIFQFQLLQQLQAQLMASLQGAAGGPSLASLPHIAAGMAAGLMLPRSVGHPQQGANPPTTCTDSTEDSTKDISSSKNLINMKPPQLPGAPPSNAQTTTVSATGTTPTPTPPIPAPPAVKMPIPPPPPVQVTPKKKKVPTATLR